MKAKILHEQTKTCTNCGKAIVNNSENCPDCSTNLKSPEFLAGIITTFLGIIAFYFIFQI